MTMRLDLATRVADIRLPDGFDPHRADLFAHHALVIAAPCERVWRHIIDAARWMDKVGMGADAAHLRETDEGLMHRGHDLWLATLKWVAERADQ